MLQLLKEKKLHKDVETLLKKFLNWLNHHRGSVKKISGLIQVIQNDIIKAVDRMHAGVKEVKIGTEVVIHLERHSIIQQLVNEVSTQVWDISATIQQLASGSQHIVMSVQTIARRKITRERRETLLNFRNGV